MGHESQALTSPTAGSSHGTVAGEDQWMKPRNLKPTANNGCVMGEMLDRILITGDQGKNKYLMNIWKLEAEGQYISLKPNIKMPASN